VVSRRRRIEPAKVTDIYVTEALDRVEAGGVPGEIVAAAGIPGGDDRRDVADPDDPRPLPVIGVDEPSLAMTTATLAARRPDGNRLTASMTTGGLDRSSSATSRCASCPPSGRTRGRCRVAASCSWRSSSS
jgi:predicted membrane GTPase involved in stress response